MSIYGYARISTSKQSIERQVRNIEREYPGAVIIREAYTGTKIDRKEWGKLFSAVQAGDTIVFDSVSRMSRNAEDGFAVYEKLYTRGVNLVFLKEPHISTDTYKRVLPDLALLSVKSFCGFCCQLNSADPIHNVKGFIFSLGFTHSHQEACIKSSVEFTQIRFSVDHYVLPARR